MRGLPIFAFILVMWFLILIGGEIAVLVLAPISISGYGDLDLIISSGIKAVIALILVAIWIFILSKIKNWIFQKQLKT